MDLCLLDAVMYSLYSSLQFRLSSAPCLVDKPTLALASSSWHVLTVEYVTRFRFVFEAICCHEFVVIVNVGVGLLNESPSSLINYTIYYMPSCVLSITL